MNIEFYHLKCCLKPGVQKQRPGRFFRFVFLLLSAWFVSLSTQATTYYIATNGNDSWTGTVSKFVSGTKGPWADFANINLGGSKSLQPGDVVYVEGGTYVVPKQTDYGTFLHLVNVNGTPASPVIISNYPGQTPLIYSSPQTNNSSAIFLSGCNWVKVFGINQTNNLYGVEGKSCTNCEFAYLNSGGAPTNTGVSCPFQLIVSSVSNYVHNCTIHDAVVSPPSSDEGHAMTFGEAFGTYGGVADLTSYNIIESNTVYHSCHDAVSIYGSSNLFAHNFIHNEDYIFRLDLQAYGAARCMEVGGVYGGSGNIVEDNRFQYAGMTYTAGGHGIEIDGAGSSIYRENTFADCPYSGITIYGGKFLAEGYWGSNYVYNNTIVTNGYGPPAITIYALNANTETWAISRIKTAAYVWLPAVTIANSTNNFFANNLFSSNYKDGTYGEDVPFSTGVRDYRGNLTAAMSKAGFVDTVDGGPWNSVLPNFHLTSTSPAIDAGAWLTTITSASGSGTSFNVANAGWFFAGMSAAGHTVAGDTIQLQGQTATATITSISGNTITVNSPLTWTKGQGVGLAYSGSAPDVGAFQYEESSAGQLLPPTKLVVTTSTQN
jgi:Right handed beta helix region